MAARNALSAAPPHAVELALSRLGGELCTARLRRNLTLDEVAAKIGAGRRAVADAEHGKATTAIAVYAGLLWASDLLADVERLAIRPWTNKARPWPGRRAARAPAGLRGWTMTSDRKAATATSTSPFPAPCRR
jgi:hypothetical protein